MRLLIGDLGNIGANLLADSKKMKTEKRGQPDEHQHLRWNARDLSEKGFFFLSRPQVN